MQTFSHTAFPLIFPEPHQAPNLMPQDEIRPTDPAPVFRRREHGLEMVTMRWGLVPWFHKGPLKGWRAMTVNARAESVATAPAFRDAFAKRRCLVPAEGWVEWKGAGKPKPKFFVQRRDGAPDHVRGAVGPLPNRGPWPGRELHHRHPTRWIAAKRPA